MTTPSSGPRSPTTGVARAARERWTSSASMCSSAPSPSPAPKTPPNGRGCSPRSPSSSRRAAIGNDASHSPTKPSPVPGGSATRSRSCGCSSTPPRRPGFPRPSINASSTPRSCSSIAKRLGDPVLLGVAAARQVRVKIEAAAFDQVDEALAVLDEVAHLDPYVRMNRPSLLAVLAHVRGDFPAALAFADEARVVSGAEPDALAIYAATTAQILWDMGSLGTMAPTIEHTIRGEPGRHRVPRPPRPRVLPGRSLRGGT